MVTITATVTVAGTTVTGSKAVRPGESGSFEITGVPAGTATLTVAGSNASGTQIYTAPPVTVAVVANTTVPAPTVVMTVVGGTSGDTTPPGPVTGFRATSAGNTSVALIWTNPTDGDFTGVRIMRAEGILPLSVIDVSNFTVTQVYDGSDAALIDTGLTQGTSYGYVAFAYDNSQNHSGGIVAAATPGGGGDTTAPGPVTAFTATAGDGSVSLSWTNPSDSDFAGVRIVRRTDQAPISAIDGTIATNTGSTTTTNFNDSSLSNGTQYFYAAFAYDAATIPNYSTAATDSATPTGGGNIAPTAFDNAATTNEDTPVIITLVATDSDGTVVSYTIVANPANGSLTGSGSLLTYSPDANFNGADSFTFKATDDNNAESNVATVSITVNPVNDPPTIGGTPALLVFQDQAYSFTPSAGDPDAGDTLSFSITPAAPSWPTFSSATGTLAGTPSSANLGSYGPFTLRVTDSTGLFAELATFSITVDDLNDAPTITNSPATAVDEDAAYDYTPTITDPDVGDTTTFSITPAEPSWLTFSTSTGQLSGTPTNANVGSHGPFPLRVTDSGGLFDEVSFSITVNNVNDAPTLTKIRDAIVGRASEWEAITKNERFLSTHRFGGDSLKRPPRGFDPDHPLTEDLKKKTHFVHTDYDEDDIIGPDFLDRFATDCAAVSPYMRFLTEAIGLPF